MRINETNQQNFKARNPEIRFADDLARKINKEYIRISATKIEAMDNAPQFSNAIEKLKLAIRNMRQETNRKIRLFGSMEEFVDILFNSTKQHKKGNCGESAELTTITAKVNGIKHCAKAYLANPYGGNFDHAVVLVKGKKPYIIDTWLGFADYVPNTIKRYQGEFRRYFDFDKYGEKMVVKVEEHNRVNEILSEKNIAKIKKAHPEIVMNTKHTH